MLPTSTRYIRMRYELLILRAGPGPTVHVLVYGTVDLRSGGIPCDVLQVLLDLESTSKLTWEELF